MEDLCDVALVLIVERVERQATVRQAVHGIHGQEAQPPSRAVAEFYADLMAEPERVDPRTWQLRRALGV